jgi:hypothetical protein
MSLLIPGTNSIKDTGYNVANSVRLEAAYMKRTVTPSTSNTWTLSFWFKKSGHNGSSEGYLFSYGSDGGQGFYITNAGYLGYYGGSSYGSDSTLSQGVLNDVSAWYHIVFSVNSGTGTLYINGVQDATISNVAPLNATTGNTYAVNSYINYEANFDNFLGYMAEYVFIDGTAYDQNSFGEFDSDSPNIWKPIDVSGLTFGTNGFYLDFEDSSNLGNDVSGNNNDFTTTGLAATDQSTDTCTNNFCTMNSLYPDGSITFSEGNLKLNQSSNSWRSAGGTIAVSTGKWYWETKTTGDYTFVGFSDIQLFSEGCSVRESFTTGATTAATAFSLRNNDPRIHSVSTSGGQTVISDSTYSSSSFTSATIGIALNLDDNEASWYIDGTVQNSGTPLSISAGTYIPGVSIYGTNVELNFGSPPYSISSGNADANGFGNFEYAVPSGYFALCTKNLAENG